MIVVATTGPDANSRTDRAPKASLSAYLNTANGDVIALSEGATDSMLVLIDTTWFWGIIIQGEQNKHC